jgi:phosphate transport system substrate-binding protein
MSLRRPLLLALAAILLVTSLSACDGLTLPATPAGEDQAPPAAVLVRVGVCWEAMPLFDDLLAAYQPDHTDVYFDVVGGTSADIARLATAHEVDLALAGQPLAPGEVAAVAGASAAPQTDWAGAGLQARPIALDAVAIIVNPGLGITSITAADLSALFDGDLGDWSLLGLDAGVPDLVVQSTGAVSRDVFDAAILPGREPASDAAILPHDQAVLDYVGAHPAAIGYLSRAYLDGSVRGLTLGTASLATDNIERGAYPLAYELVTLTHADTPQAALDLLSFAATSRGRRIIAARYVLPG